MRKVLLLAVAVVACSKTEKPAADTAAAAPPPAPVPAAPAALTAADLAGNWTGESKMAGTDSVVSHWTAVHSTDSTGKLAIQGSKDSIAYTVKLDADSMMATSVAYKDPGLPKKTPPVIFKTVGRLKDGKMVGTSTLVLASKPDSVIGKTTFVANKAP